MGYIFAATSTALWSVNFIIARALNETISPVSLAFLRWTVAVLVFSPFALRGAIRQRRLVRKNFLYILVCALLGVTLFNTLIYFAGRTSPAINLSLISMIFPVFVLILARLVWGERIGVLRSAGVGVVLLGVVILISDGRVDVILSLAFSPGDILVLLAASVFAGYSMLVRRKPPELSATVFQYATFVFGLVMLAPAFLIDRITSPPLTLAPSTLSAIVYIGVFASLVAFLTWNRAVGLVGPSRASMMYYTLPVFSGILAYFFLGEEFGLTHLVSLALVVAGIFMATRKPAAKMSPATVLSLERK